MYTSEAIEQIAAVWQDYLDNRAARALLQPRPSRTVDWRTVCWCMHYWGQRVASTEGPEALNTIQEAVLRINTYPRYRKRLRRMLDQAFQGFRAKPN